MLFFIRYEITVSRMSIHVYCIIKWAKKLLSIHLHIVSVRLQIKIDCLKRIVTVEVTIKLYELTNTKLPLVRVSELIIILKVVFFLPMGVRKPLTRR